MQRKIVDVVIAEKVDLISAMEADGLHTEAQEIIDGELAQLTSETENYWAQTMEVC